MPNFIQELLGGRKILRRFYGPTHIYAIFIKAFAAHGTVAEYCYFIKRGFAFTDRFKAKTSDSFILAARTVVSFSIYQPCRGILALYDDSAHGIAI